MQQQQRREIEIPMLLPTTLLLHVVLLQPPLLPTVAPVLERQRNSHPPGRELEVPHGTGHTAELPDLTDKGCSDRRTNVHNCGNGDDASSRRIQHHMPCKNWRRSPGAKRHLGARKPAVLLASLIQRAVAASKPINFLELTTALGHMLVVERCGHEPMPSNLRQIG